MDARYDDLKDNEKNLEVWVSVVHIQSSKLLPANLRQLLTTLLSPLQTLSAYNE